MPEVQAPAAPQSGAAPAAPAGQSAQAQAPAIDPAEFNRFKSEYERLAPLEQQFKKGTTFYQTASKYGLKDENALNSWGGFISKASTKGMSPDKLAALFEDPAPEQGEKPLTLQSIQELLDKRDKDRSMSDAKSQAEKDLEAEFEHFSDARIAAIVGDQAPPELKEFVRAAGIGSHFLSRQAYPEGHPLAGQLGPAGKDWSGKLESLWKTGLTAAQAHKLAKLGDAARRPGISTPAGNTAPGGKPADKPDTTKMTREQRLEASIAQATQAVTGA